jgi:predicted nucleic acid-binding Zn ribbon protein
MSVADYMATPAPLCMEEGCDGQQRMVSQVHAAGLSFKGTGWTPKFKKSSTSAGAPTDILTKKRR